MSGKTSFISIAALWVVSALCQAQSITPLQEGRAEGDRNYPPSDAIKLVEIAVKRNPALASAHFYAEALHADAAHYAAWEAPEVGVDFFQAPIANFPNPLKDQREIDYYVSQTIPFPGKLSAMARPEHLRGTAEESRAAALSLDLRRQILSAYADRYFSEWRLRLIGEDRIEVERLSGVARAGYENGMGSQADLLRAESETARLDAEALQAGAQRLAAQAALENLIGGPEDTMAAVDSLFPQPIPYSLDSLKKKALSRRPDLDAQHLEMEMAKAETDAKSREAYPDFMVRGMYKDMRADAEGFWSVMVGMKVPIAPWSWPGVRAGLDQSRLLHHKSEQDYESMRLAANAEVDRAAAALSSAQGRIELEQSRRIPLARQVLRSSLAAYQGGRTDFNNVLAAFREARMSREEYHLAVSDHLKAWADLEYATGGELSILSLKD